MRIGFAKDIHKLIESTDDNFVLGGTNINNTGFKVCAKSDGDIVLHSITSAILGALDLDTLGEYFPDTDDINQDRTSTDFLKFAIKKMVENNFKIISMDLCIVCEQIMLKDHLINIKNKLNVLIDSPHIGLKCTRFEDKSNYMIECYCTILLNKC
ncbi:MAG: 2-C-methyl-D-erythritol 2,4-cyclodiphosphate synthase [Mycoplasma sp.]